MSFYFSYETQTVDNSMVGFQSYPPPPSSFSFFNTSPSNQNISDGEKGGWCGGGWGGPGGGEGGGWGGPDNSWADQNGWSSNQEVRLTTSLSTLELQDDSSSNYFELPDDIIEGIDRIMSATGSDIRLMHPDDGKVIKPKMEKKSPRWVKSKKNEGKSIKGMIGKFLFMDSKGEHAKETGRITSKKIIVSKKHTLLRFFALHIFLIYNQCHPKI